MFLKDPKTFVAVLLSFIYATPVELGFDPDIIECTPAQGGPQYFVYTVDDNEGGKLYFRTLQSLSEYRSHCISGRATRVWKVIQVTSLVDHSPVHVDCGGVVLKDIWLQRDATTERNLQTALFGDIEAFRKQAILDKGIPRLKSSGPTLEQSIRDLLVDETYKKHFLTIMFDRLGPASKECPPFARSDPALFNMPLTQVVPPRSRAADHSRESSGSLLFEQTSINTTPTTVRKFAPKCRYVVVFKELCKTVENLTSFTDVSNAMMDTVKGDSVFLSIFPTLMDMNFLQLSSSCGSLAGSIVTLVPVIFCGYKKMKGKAEAS